MDVSSAIKRRQYSWADVELRNDRSAAQLENAQPPFPAARVDDRDPALSYTRRDPGFLDIARDLGQQHGPPLSSGFPITQLSGGFSLREGSLVDIIERCRRKHLETASHK